MDNQGNGEEPDVYELLRKLIEMSRADVGTHDQISAVREELISAKNDIAQFKTQTDGAVDANLRLTAEIELNLSEALGSLQDLGNVIERQQLHSRGLMALSLLHALAIMRLSKSGQEEFAILHHKRYVDGILTVGRLINETQSAEIQDLQGISDQIYLAFKQVFELPAPTSKDD